MDFFLEHSWVEKFMEYVCPLLEVRSSADFAPFPIIMSAEFEHWQRSNASFLGASKDVYTGFFASDQRIGEDKKRKQPIQQICSDR